MPFDLHPEIPREGRELGHARAARYRAHMQPVMEAEGLVYDPPSRVPNTHLALEASEWMRTNAGDDFDRFHRSVFEAYFAHGRDIGSSEVLLDLAGSPDGLADALDRGDMARAVRESTERGLDVGVAGTPAWLIDGRLLVPGAQPREAFDRILQRLAT
jgi:predicted DsbA family dithiol-disulfide isomerase